MSRFLLVAGLALYGFLVDPASGRHGIPCLWKTLTGMECPGCGLSRAGAHLVRGHFAAALKQNALIMPVTFLLLMHAASPLMHRQPK
jgi:hypothetical protein